MPQRRTLRLSFPTASEREPVWDLADSKRKSLTTTMWNSLVDENTPHEHSILRCGVLQRSHVAAGTGKWAWKSPCWGEYSNQHKQPHLFFLQKMKPPTATMTRAPKIHPNTAPKMTPGQSPNRRYLERCSCRTLMSRQLPHSTGLGQGPVCAQSARVCAHAHTHAHTHAHGGQSTILGP